MPPNRKTDLSSQDFASLDVILHTLKTAVDVVAPQPQPPSNHVSSYWDWPTTAVVVDEETIIDQHHQPKCLNTHHIESNLLREAQRLQEKIQTTTIRFSQQSQRLQASDHDSYWDMATTTAEDLGAFLETKQSQKAPAASRSTRHHPAPTGADMTNYWDQNNAVSSSSRDDHGDRYWNDPAHSHYKKMLMSTRDMSSRVDPKPWKQQQQHHAAPVDLDRDAYWSDKFPTTKSSTTTSSDEYWNDPAESHNKQLEYWDWPSFQAKEDRVAHLRMEHKEEEEERAHRLTSAAFVEKQLLEQAAAACNIYNIQQQPETSVAANDDYYWTY
jgi:hypothetical protein